ncbi:DUF6087 family protein [Kitasatospora mediocidica]|uniref:DUF6087 family protein n=1 Tax=Kitasatospora mediocidica TaxID=58352 RepID=UPI0005641CCE|nr:DUF6087 family protein [Kitasatospora mediocidica]
MDDQDEPLEKWAARWERRLRPVGQLRVVALDGTVRAAHVNPGAPRLIQEWDGVQWVPVTVADDYAAAQRHVNGIIGDGVMRDMLPAPAPRKAAGRHRRA